MVEGPYLAILGGEINYSGNKVFKPVEDIGNKPLDLVSIEDRANQISNSSYWKHIANINHRIFIESTRFFDEMDALFTLLPLTTRMISSPGAVYGKEAIDYTTDTSPIRLRWFNLENEVFLSESSQIYLELATLQKDVKHVFSIYNSFRKEEADLSHLSEFHHIEYEGKISQSKNEDIISNLLFGLIESLLDKNYEDLSFFLEADSIEELEQMSVEDSFKKISFETALNLLYENTGRDVYKLFTARNFHSWEEIKLTEILDNKFVVVKNFPLLEVPFYHAVVDGSEPRVADNADFIWPGYREVVGSGHRVRTIEELEKKARIFNLPREDYQPYFDSRKQENYSETSGFGVGWERFLQGLLKMPNIISVSNFPRVHTTLKP